MSEAGGRGGSARGTGTLWHSSASHNRYLQQASGNPDCRHSRHDRPYPFSRRNRYGLPAATRSVDRGEKV